MWQHKVGDSYTGRIEMVVGPMFSGKTSELIRRLKRHSIAGMKCLAIKYQKDIRYSADNISTHEKVIYHAKPAMELLPLFEEARRYDVIGIDEGQFFGDVIKFATDLRNCGKTVIISALDMDFRREPFAFTAMLMAISDECQKMKSVCVVCKKDAAFSKRLIDDTSLEVIGGSEVYAATCLLCHQTATELKSLRAKNDDDIL